MQVVANFEITTELSVIADELILRIKHPLGLYRARIQNIPRSVYTTPFLLSMHLYFEAPTLDEAKDAADERLADCLNMLAFTTGSAFRRHRIRQIVDATPGVTGMRSLLMWADKIEYEDPQPFLSEDSVRMIERLSEFEIPPPVRRALRWYRLGVNATAPDDQFMNFWFALEIIAEFRKSSDKVPDRCPQCRSPLYCESCKTNPVHRPYAKQAIRDLLKAVDKDCDDSVIDRLDKTRNGLMHGSTLREIEESLPEPHEEIVDVLGRLLWRALIFQFPHGMFDGTLPIGYPSTYVHRTARAIAHLQTIVPIDSHGDLDLRFPGMTTQMVPFGPPQSATPSVFRLTPEQHERLAKLRWAKGDQQPMCQRIYDRTQEKGNDIFVLVLATDVATIKDALKRGQTGEWQDLLREIIGSGG
jgi:hypothetical protein